MSNIHLLISYVTIFSFLMLNAQQPPKISKNYTPSDMQTITNGPLPYDYRSDIKYRKITTTSLYLTMRDSVKIAVNITLPKGLKDGEKIPAILYQTRYWRAASFRFPFNLLWNSFSGDVGKMIKNFIRCGYALVAVDVRGSGASFGCSKHPWTKDEIQDGYKIVDWIINQPWSNGIVGASGISYSGTTTAEFLATTMHPAVKAVAPMFSLYDVYDDISFPGGVQLKYFTENWGAANHALDNNRLPVKKILPRMAVKGVQPVKGHKWELKHAIADHRNNVNVHNAVRTITYRDDVSAIDHKTSPDQFSPHAFSQKIDSAGIAVYSISGYFDGGYQHAAIKRFLTLKNPQNKLLLGPWEHGGWMNCSWHNPGKAGFDKTSELLKFFNYHLKGIETNIYKEPRVYYYTMGEEKWKSSDVWPPANTYYQKIFLGEGNRLLIFPPTENNYSYTAYKTDTTFGSGTYSRWRSLMGKLEIPFPYFEWHERSKNLLHFSTEPLRANTEITGHPIVTLYVNSTATDGIFIAYLEDVDENGIAHYVTEGQLRALHRKVSDEQRPYQDVAAIPYHSFLRKDGALIDTSQIELITFELLPVSYMFKKGHRIRLSISGGDKDHFQQVVNEANWQIMHNRLYASYIELPLVR
jgi:hypothetical protein